jgi:uncharacterized protein (DUF4415 family)
MTVRRRSAAESRIYVELLALLDAIERAEAADPPTAFLIPPSRRGAAPSGAETPEKVQVTLHLDGETAKWIRASGRGFQARVNRVLRNYMLEATARAEARATPLLAPPRRSGGAVSGGAG